MEENKDLFAQTDAGLGHIDTVKMKLDTGKHPPVKVKPYITPLNKRKMIDIAVDEMLEVCWDHPEIVVSVELPSGSCK